MFWNHRREATRLSIQPNLRKARRQRRGLRWIVPCSLRALLSGLALVVAFSLSVQAAVELSAYQVLVLPTGVVVEWQTASEYDLIGFEIWYKEADASQSAYKLLGKRIAQGGPRRGVTYRMDVTTSLKPETAYCFQLRELPLNGERGEILNRCGYGLGISAQPTPTPTPLVTPTSPFTPTTGLTTTTPLTATQAITDPFAPFATPTIDPFALPTPTIDPFAPPTPFVDPFAPPLTGTIPGPTNTFPISPSDPNQGASFVVPTPMPTPFGQSILPTPAFPTDGGQGVFPTPTLPLLTTPVTTAVGAFDATALNAPVDPFAPTTTVTNGVASGAQTVFSSTLATPNPVELAVANPPYLVLTATPTTAAATPAPTFTPYPTGLPPQGETLLGLQAPDTQNLMIMLLCGVFSGASGLGILGVVSTLLYMRSRATARQTRTNQRQFGD